MKRILIVIIAVIVVFNFSCEEPESHKNIVPTCVITNPKNGDEVEIGNIVTISVEAADTDGEIIEVRFYINNLKLNSVFTLPYEYNWNTSSFTVGSNSIKAVAIDNNSDSTSNKLIVSIVDNNPKSEFSCDQTQVYKGQNLDFIDQSTNNPVNWFWDFGDGNTSTEQNPSHFYSEVGNYDISLQVTNEFGSDTELKINYITVQPSETGTITDFDGNVYGTIKIGEQWWMSENLKTTHYANGNEITLVESSTDWDNLPIGDFAYCYYENSATNASTYGAIYNWFAAVNGAESSNNNPSGLQGVCPDGWHLPSDMEWKELEFYLGMSQSEADNTGWRGTIEGTKLKSTNLWDSNGAGNNLTGFSALPSGARTYQGDFSGLGNIAVYWCATDANNGYSAWFRSLSYDNYKIKREYANPSIGYSVRCIKD